MKAHSIQQYNKWKAWERGEIKNRDMFILAQTYINEIISICYVNEKDLQKLTDTEVFKLVAESITID